MNRTLSSLHGGSIEAMLSVPLLLQWINVRPWEWWIIICKFTELKDVELILAMEWGMDLLYVITMKRTFLETLHLKKGMSDSHHNGNLRIFFLLIRKITTLFLINMEDYDTFYGRLRHFFWSIWKITTLFMEDYDNFSDQYGRLRHFSDQYGRLTLSDQYGSYDT